MSRAVAPAPVRAAVPIEARLPRRSPSRAQFPLPRSAGSAALLPRRAHSAHPPRPPGSLRAGGAPSSPGPGPELPPGPRDLREPRASPGEPLAAQPGAQRSPARRFVGGSGRGLARGSPPRPRYLRAAASCWAGSRPGWTSRAPLGPAAEPEGGRAAPPSPAPPRGAAPAPHLPGDPTDPGTGTARGTAAASPLAPCPCSAWAPASTAPLSPCAPPVHPPLL